MIFLDFEIVLLMMMVLSSSRQCEADAVYAVDSIVCNKFIKLLVISLLLHLSRLILPKLVVLKKLSMFSMSY